MSTILVIEDDGRVQDSITDLLETKNYNVLKAQNGKDGIQMAIDHKPDLILCDIMMGSLNGFSVLHSIRELPEVQSTPFIFLSALAEQKYVKMGLEKGADKYLTKPFKSEELFLAIHELLTKS
ncbi:MAG: response regulator transcription factor [Cyclobacteriaceae bacterium]|jgi:DNA-binding response OmpR family regulator